MMLPDDMYCDRCGYYLNSCFCCYECNSLEKDCVCVYECCDSCEETLDECECKLLFSCLIPNFIYQPKQES